jgi:negative regulator of flagellin synthesis FlgM
MTSINNVNAGNVSRTYVQGADAAQTAAAQQVAKHGRHRTQAPTADSVTLSDSARSLAAARDAVKSAPDVRDAKVADIKQRVDTGTYEVSSRVLAKKIVDASKNPS